MYSILLPLHNLNRWALLLVGLAALARAAKGRNATPAQWERPDETLRKVFPILFEVQLLLGIGLYATSPLVRAGLSMGGAMMRNAELRLFIVEHLFTGLLAVAAARVGSIRVRKTEDLGQRHRKMFSWYLVALLLALSRMPFNRWLPHF